MAETFNDSVDGQLLLLIREGHLDRRKQNSLYQDDDMILAVEEEFAEMQVGGIRQIANEAQQALASPFNQAAARAARAFYEANDTRRFRQRPAAIAKLNTMAEGDPIRIVPHRGVDDDCGSLEV